MDGHIFVSTLSSVAESIYRRQTDGRFVAPFIREKRLHLCFSSTCSLFRVACRNKQSFAQNKRRQSSEVGIHSSEAESSSISLVSDEEDGSDEFSEDDTFETNNPNHRSGYVAVIGRPNVGKSTLVNQLVGEKMSIVTAKPQTTRHRILGLCSGPDYQIILYDTPGIIEKNRHKLDAMMMKNVRRAKFDAECAVVVVDVSKISEKVDESLEGVIGHLKGLQTLLVLNKKDLLKPGEISKKLKWFEKFTNVDDVIPVSSKYAEGVIDVKCWILSKLPYGPAYYSKEVISEHPERFFIAEIVREKILMLYRHEIPYACQVDVVDYISRPNGKDYIKVEILVEKTSQKIILIGKEGTALKTAAMASRVDVEELVGKGVYMEVHVKVKEAWRKDERFIKEHVYLGHMG